MARLADLSTDSVWLFTIDEARKKAQQHSEKNQRRLLSVAMRKSPLVASRKSPLVAM